MRVISRPDLLTKEVSRLLRAYLDVAASDLVNREPLIEDRNQHIEELSIKLGASPCSYKFLRYYLDTGKIRKTAGGIKRPIRRTLREYGQPIISDLSKCLEKQFGSEIHIAGLLHYMPGDFVSWHTNQGNYGKRIYFVWCRQANRSYFRYWDEEKVVTDTESQGWQVREFDIEENKPLWHCIQSDTERYSIGFNIPSTEAKTSGVGKP